MPTTPQCVLTDEVPSLSNTGKLSSGTGLVNVVDCRQMPCGGTWDVGECEKGLGVSFLLQMSEGGLEAHQGPCGGDGEEAAPHIGPVAQGNRPAALEQRNKLQVADGVMTAQGGVALPRDGAYNQPIRPVQGKAKQDELITLNQP